MGITFAIPHRRSKSGRRFCSFHTIPKLILVADCRPMCYSCTRVVGTKRLAASLSDRRFLSGISVNNLAIIWCSASRKMKHRIYI
jgi:hypothetical protein